MLKDNAANPLSRKSNTKDIQPSCIIKAGTTIEGTITSKENIQLEGVIIGDITSEKDLFIGDSGMVTGNTSALNLEAKGKITGDVHIKEIIHLSGEAFVKGTIHARQLVVEEGARYDGECKIG